MTALRQQMVEAMVAHGLVVRMSWHFGRSPDCYLISPQFKPPQQADMSPPLPPHSHYGRGGQREMHLHTPPCQA